MATTEYPYGPTVLLTKRWHVVALLTIALVALGALMARKFVTGTSPAMLLLPIIALAVMMALVAYRGLRFLATQETKHSQPTEEMTFVFRLIAFVPFVGCVLLMLLVSRL